MEYNKIMQLPKGWKFYKTDGNKVYLTRETNPIIKWNKEKDGVEVIDGVYHFIVANIPSAKCNWYAANNIIKRLGGYMPSLKELKCFYKNRKKITQCFEENTGYKVINPNAGFWSSDIPDDERYAHVLNSYNQFCKPCPKQNRHDDIDLKHEYKWGEKSYFDFNFIVFKK